MNRTETLEASKQAVILAIRRAFSDVGQSTPERRAAVEVIKELERLGWMDPFTVRALVAAAGGKIKLDDSDLVDPPEELMLFRQQDPPGYVLRTRRVVRLD